MLAVAFTARSAEYPRRIAIAPFVPVAQDNIAPIVSVLPRLLSSRLMALAGAEVVLLPPGPKSPSDAAREAKVPLLIEGTVAKLGKGYSIDITATDLDGGKTAGAFFASAANEDEIIPRLGDLAGEVSGKLFGVKVVVRTSPPAAAPDQGPAPQVLPAFPAPSPAAIVPRPPFVGVGPSAATAGPATTAEGWLPSTLRKVSQSDRIVDELYGAAAGDIDDEGNGEVVAYGKRTVYIYRIKGFELLPYTRITRGKDHHFLNVDTIDLDGDGRKEILVTDLVGERIESFVLSRKGETFEEAAGMIPYFLVVLPDWEGKPVLVGQHRGMDTPFQGKFMKMGWDGKELKETAPLPVDTNITPLSSGILGLTSARLQEGWRLIYTDESERLRVLDAGGKSDYKSREKYGSAADYFEWGPVVRIEGKRNRTMLNKAGRPAGGSDGKPFLLIPGVKKGSAGQFTGSYESSRLVLLQWDGSEFLERAATTKSDSFYTGGELLSPPGLRRGAKVVASVIVRQGSAFTQEESRLALLVAE